MTDFSLGTAYVDLDVRGRNSLNNSFRDVERKAEKTFTDVKRTGIRSFDTFSQSAKKSLTNVAGGFGPIGTAVLGLASTLAVSKLYEWANVFVTAASDAAETASKTSIVFGESFEEIRKWAEGAADAMGLSSTAAMDAASTMGNMFKQLGSGTKVAAENSKAMVQLAADLASFHNVAGGAPEVLAAMQSAFRGEYDALQRYIPTINAAAVQTQALANTSKTSTKELTDLEKATAAMQIIMKDAGDAVGDFERTSGGYANQVRILKANLDELKVEMGEKLIPVFSRVIEKINEGIDKLDDFKNKAKEVADFIVLREKDFRKFLGMSEKDIKLQDEFLDRLSKAKDFFGNYEDALEAVMRGWQGVYKIEKQVSKDTEKNIDNLSKSWKRYSEEMVRDTEHAIEVYLGNLKLQAKERENTVDIMTKIDEDYQKSLEIAAKKEYDERVAVLEALTQAKEEEASKWVEISESASYNMRNAFSESFFAVMRGDLDEFGEIWKGFLNSMLRSISDFLADQAISGLVGFFGGLFGGGSGGGGLAGGIGGTIGGIIKGFFQTGSHYVPETGIYGLHKGEMVIPPKEADLMRQAMTGVGEGSAGSTAAGAGMAAFLWGEHPTFGTREQKEIKDFISWKRTLPAFLSGGALGAGGQVLGDIGQYAVMRDMNLRGNWALGGGRIGGALGMFAGMGNPALSLMGRVAGSMIGAPAGDLLGDLFNMRETEQLRDFLESSKTGKGYFGGREIFADEFWDRETSKLERDGTNWRANLSATFGNFMNKNRESFENLGIDVDREIATVTNDVMGMGLASAKHMGEFETKFTLNTIDMGEKVDDIGWGFTTFKDSLTTELGDMTENLRDVNDYNSTMASVLDKAKEIQGELRDVVDIASRTRDEVERTTREAREEQERRRNGGMTDRERRENREAADIAGEEFHRGTSYVPATKRYMLQQGEMVIPANMASQMRHGGLGRPIQLIVQLPTGEFTAFVDTRVDRQRVKLNRRSTPTKGTTRLVR